LNADVSYRYLIPVTERQPAALYPFKSRGFGGEIGLNYPELWNSEFVYGRQMMDDNIKEVVSAVSEHHIFQN